MSNIRSGGFAAAGRAEMGRQRQLRTVEVRLCDKTTLYFQSPHLLSASDILRKPAAGNSVCGGFVLQNKY